ncbi:TetR/AcrR family transcriptional regulator [Micromonospora arborensis]|uniref:TetR/AcrR family transcriptional regulator n=1 Tax=Micromonospora arborensis TaxID=2116518 RepID=UPI00371644C9
MVAQELSLRERKKQQTRSRLWRTAIELFGERGFDQVSVAEIAAAAEVSKMTVFNYFATKEDLVLGPMQAHVGDLARIVRERDPGESVVEALRRQYLDRLAARDPSVGLNDDPTVLRVQRLVQSTPALLKGAYDFLVRSQDLLARELATMAAQDRPNAGGGPAVAEFTARAAAAQIAAVRNTLYVEIIGRLLAGESADEIYPDAVRLVEQSFDLLERGLRGFGGPSGSAPTAPGAE